MTGNIRVTTPMLKIACPKIQAAIAAVEIFTMGSSWRMTTRIIPIPNAANSTMTRSAPRKPSSSPMIAKIKSFCASGDTPIFR